MSTISDKIRRIRESKDLTQEYMADKLNLSQPAYRRIECGETKMDIERLFKISEVLQVDPYELMQLDNQPIIQYNNKIGQNIIKENYSSPELKDVYQQLIQTLKSELEQCRREKNELLQLILKMNLKH